MIGRWLNALDHLPRWWQRGLLIVFPLLLFGVLVAAFALSGTSVPVSLNST